MNGNGLVAQSGWWTINKPLENIINQLQLQRTFGDHLIDAMFYFSAYSAKDFWYLHNILTEVNDSPRMLNLSAFDENGNEIAAVTHNGFEQYGTFYVNSESYANVFAASLVDEWKPTESMRVDAGFRLEHSRYWGEVENTDNSHILPNINAYAAENVSFGVGTFRNFRHSFNEWAVSLGINYALTETAAVYTRASRGFRTP